MELAWKFRRRVWVLGVGLAMACVEEADPSDADGGGWLALDAGGGEADASVRDPDGGAPFEGPRGADSGGPQKPDAEPPPTSTAPDASLQADAHVSNPDAGHDAGAAPDRVGEGGTVHETIVVRSGETFDGLGKRYVAGTALGDGSQSESQQPVFKLEDGARLVNVVLGAPAADGIHTYGDVVLKNIVWEDVGEDALTIKESGTVVLDGGSATLADDKVFQINAASTFRVSNFRASHGGKFIRQNGGTKFKVDVFIDRCDIAHMKEAIFRTDSNVSTVQMTNTRYSAIGKELFMGVNAANVTLSNNTAY